MKIKITAHIKQHAGDSLCECQDSFSYNLEKCAFAVSDGVGQAYRPELWSRILTREYVNNPDNFIKNDGDNDIRINTELKLPQKWKKEELEAYQKATPQEQFLLDLKKGQINIAAATFIGIQLKDNCVHYYAIGDSVLFFYDYGNKKLKRISSMLTENGEMFFSNSPEYVDSDENINGKIIEGVLGIQEGVLIMATDALSDWISEICHLENFEALLEELISISSHKDYDKFIDSKRIHADPVKIKDDDTTFIALKIQDIENLGISFDLGFAKDLPTLIALEDGDDLQESQELEVAPLVNKIENENNDNSENNNDNKKLQSRMLLEELEKSKQEITKLRQKIQELETEKKNLELLILNSSNCQGKARFSKLSSSIKKGKNNKKGKRH